MHARARSLFVLAILVAWCACAFALDPSLEIRQYAHTSWKIRDGFTKGTIGSISQTRDGYLWLGTMSGLYRFDGVFATLWHPPAGQQLPTESISSLLVSHDGRLWIGTTSGLASWKDGQLTKYQEFAGQTIFSIIEDHEGTVWATTWLLGSSPTLSKLCAVRRGQIECYGLDSFKQGIESVYEDSRGNLWVTGLDGVWRWRPGPQKRYSTFRTSRVIEADDGAILLATREGLRRLAGPDTEKYALPGLDFQFTAQRLFRSSDDSLWIGTLEHGIVHLHRGNADWFAQSDGLSGNYVMAFFQDREGNVWVSTTEGLDRFHDLAVPTISTGQGLADSTPNSVLAASDGSVWVSSPSGLNRWKKDEATLYRREHAKELNPVIRTSRSVARRSQEVSNTGLPAMPESLFEDDAGKIWATTTKGVVRWDGSRFVPINGVPGLEVFGIAEDLEHTVWLNSRYEGLIRVSNGGKVEKIPWTSLGHHDYATAIANDPSGKGLWVGFTLGGLISSKDGEVSASYTSADGLGTGIVTHLRFGTRGTLWAATQGGLSRVKERYIATLTSKNGLPCDTVHWSMEDDEHSVWLYMPCGLVEIVHSELEAWDRDPKHIVQNTVYDISDGVRTRQLIGAWGPKVSKSKDGRIWFAVDDGVSVINPHNLHENKIPPPVHIEKITADDKTVGVSNGIHLPSGVRHLDIDYTALSLVIPEKVRFRVKLEGEDNDWRELVNVRHVEYTNLPPKHYKFRVLACNNSGVWNEEGASLEFVIPPMWYQTNWFRSLCAAVFLALIWMLHQVRLRQQARQFNRTLEARVGERTRIARELHDTLLQSFHGLLVQLQSVLQLLPARPLDARQRLAGTIDDAAAAITEARDAVQGLRSSTISTNELTGTLRTLGKELAFNEANPTSPRFGVEVFGTPRELHPVVRDEVYRVASEALRNAFFHAHAQQIEVELRYEDGELLVAIRDDGKGIDPQVLAGKSGHFGLPGMHERAKLIGGKLEVWSELNEGTEIELTIPAANAYAKLMHRTIWLRRLSRIGKDKQTKIEL